MSLKVKFHSLFRIKLKSRGHEYQLEDEIDVMELIDLLDDDYDGYFSKKLLDAGEISPGSIILVNGENVIHKDGVKTKIKDGDTVTLFPPSAGG
ncbi:MoaD family protein [Halanaerobium sp. Z-7514]|uniref:MoaD family protein n=1 Tax=Halanaerobium polyolivorans TaxID=2886943 RepID=A0AAW4X022_9FIRM|nr:MoaD family protein [Halanaerobium polyolivorans]MCC3144541.1 MoaD family protein [Halanaerobium polyolivorans]RQD77300.1 MAG: MoaD family protein [Halanaerobium sp. MSAO_Bac5]